MNIYENIYEKEVKGTGCGPSYHLDYENSLRAMGQIILEAEKKRDAYDEWEMKWKGAEKFLIAYLLVWRDSLDMEDAVIVDIYTKLTKTTNYFLNTVDWDAMFDILVLISHYLEVYKSHPAYKA